MTEDEAVCWILAEFETAGSQYQKAAASHLVQLNDETLAYFDKSSSLYIGKGLLRIFYRLIPEAVCERAGKS